MPVGLDQAGLPVLPQAFQSGKVPNSRGLWWPVATSTWDLVRDLGRAPPWSLEAEKAEPRSSGTTGSAQVDGYRMCCPRLSSSSQGYELLVQRGAKPPRSAGAGGRGDTTGSEGQAAHPQVSRFFSYLLCNVEL